MFHIDDDNDFPSHCISTQSFQYDSLNLITFMHYLKVEVQYLSSPDQTIIYNLSIIFFSYFQF